MTDTAIMVLIASWDEFSRAAERLYLNNPDKCRFVVKYRHTNGKLYVKITDDSTVYQYETEVTYDLRSMPLLKSLLRYMAATNILLLVLLLLIYYNAQIQIIIFIIITIATVI